MGRNMNSFVKSLGIGLGLVLVAAVGIPGVSAATGTPLYPECPAAGPDSGCGVLITVNANGSTTVATDPSQPALDGGSGVLVGVVNDSNTTVSGISVSGPDSFALGGKGVCTVHPSPCFSPTEFGPTGYEGPGTTVTPTGSSDGTVGFVGGMAPEAGTYFSLSGSPLTVSSADLEADISVGATDVAPYTGIPFSGAVGTFDVGNSDDSPVADFSATVAWGDGSTSDATISQPGGPGSSYVLTGDHTYASSGSYTDTVTVDDTVITTMTNQGQGSATSDVTTEPVSITPAAVPDQLAGSPFSGEVATFTSPVAGVVASDFSVTLDWGDGGSGPGTITQPGGPGTPFEVSGSYTWASSGQYDITVAVTYDGVTADGLVQVEVDAAQTTVPCTGSCSGGVTTDVQTSTGTTSSGSGSLFVSLSDGSLDCTSGTPYDYAPQITTVSTTGVPLNATVRVHVTFLREHLQGPAGAPIEVCFASNIQFTTLGGGSGTPEVIDGQDYYVGLLPRCVATSPQRFGPCLGHVSEPVPGWRTVVENVKFPAGDPKQR